MVSQSFAELFSKQASEYAQYRLTYPREFFAELVKLAPAADLAWDCGTGSGQAAIGLSEFFSRIVATDISPEQIAQARTVTNVDYAVCPAEKTSLASRSVDLITVAQAIHWFDLERFYTEAQRVLKEQGIIAVWCYNHPKDTEAVRPILRKLYLDIVGQYWSERVRLVEKRYETIPFPFAELQLSQEFSATTNWNLEQFIGYIRSWSATQAYIAANGKDPVDLVKVELLEAWGDPAKSVQWHWPINLRIGRYV